MLHQAAMLIIFFCSAVPKTANASPSGVQARIYFAISLRSVNSIACGSKAASLFFYLVDEIQSRFYKIKQWALKTVAAAASSLIL